MAAVYPAGPEPMIKQRTFSFFVSLIEIYFLFVILNLS
jgi:hypothetical protein